MSEEEQKITLQIRNVSAKSRYMFNQACKHLCKERGDVMSVLLRQFAEEKFGLEFSSVWEENFDAAQENQQAFQKSASNTQGNNAISKPSDMQSEPSGLDCE